jgi:hypothetical protein
VTIKITTITKEEKKPLDPKRFDAAKKVKKYASQALEVLRKDNPTLAKLVSPGDVAYLIGLRPLYELLKLAVWTGCLEGQEPVSCIIVASPSAGKTEIMKRVACPPFAVEIDDLTSKTYSDKLREPRTRHLILGDLTSLFGHRSSTVKLALNMLRRAVAEGVFTDSYTGQTITHRHVGLITGIPPEDFESPEVEAALHSGGLDTRFIVASYGLSVKTVQAGHASITDGDYEAITPIPVSIANSDYGAVTPIPWKITLPEKKVKVIIPKDGVGDKLETLSLLLQSDPIGFRTHKHLRALLAASAAERGNTVADINDFLRVQALAEFFTVIGRKL